jgi:tetratricopeptide (TPR) repeat protein
MSTACHHLGDLERAEELSLAALAIQRQLGNRRSEAISLSSLANVFYETGRVEQARELLEQSLAIHREVGNRRSEGVALTGLASVYQAAGQLEKAEHLFRDALNIHRETQNRRAEGVVVGNLADLLRINKRAAEARGLFVLALNIHTECGNAAFLSGHTCNYALCLLALRDQTSRETWQRGFDGLRVRQNRKEIQRALIAMRKACAEAGVPPFEVPNAEAE